MPNLVNLKIENESILPRIVGFHEYHNALKLFDRLSAISTAEEMKVYDEVFKKRPEFAIFVGQPSTVGLRGDRIVFTRTFKQSGLNWITALARVELGSMIAAFSEKENPFREVAPTKFDAAEFNLLLSEGWESHRVAIQVLAKLNEEAKGKTTPGSRAGAIVKIARRSKLASDIVVVAAGTMNPSTSEGKYEQLQKAYDQLQDYRDQLSNQLTSEMKRAAYAGSGSPGWQTSSIPSCARGGVEAALAQGKFSVKPLQ